MKYCCQVPGYTYSCPDTGREYAGLDVEADSVDGARAKALEAYGITGGIPLGKVICQEVETEEADTTPELPPTNEVEEETESVAEPSLWSVPTSPADPPAPVAMGPAPVDLE